MGHVRHAEQQRVTASAKQPSSGVVNADHSSRVNDILQRIQQLAALQRYDDAIDQLEAAGNDRQLLNAKGVCLMRTGRFAEAIRLYRDLVIHSGCTWMRHDVPLVYRTNYATALALGGIPSGCLAILAELKDEQNLTVTNLRAAIRAWESQLSFWQQLNWRLGRIEPVDRPVTVTFEAGEFEPFPSREDSPPVGPRDTPKAA